MAAIVKSFDKVSGRFACIWGGIRTSERSHDWSEEAAAVISKNPDDVTEWLRLADRLEDEGNPAHHVIRAAFEDGYAPPAGFVGELRRGGRYMENGQHYSESVYFNWNPEREDWAGGERITLPAGFTLHYWNGNGNSYSHVEPAEVRSLLAGKGRRTNWCDVVAEGITAPVSRVVPAGSTVVVLKAKSNGEPKIVNAHHTTSEDIPVPADTRSHHMADIKGSVKVAQFDYKGYIVRVKAEAVAVC